MGSPVKLFRAQESPFPVPDVDPFPTKKPAVNRPPAWPYHRQCDPDVDKQNVSPWISKMIVGVPEANQCCQQRRNGRPKTSHQQRPRRDGNEVQHGESDKCLGKSMRSRPSAEAVEDPLPANRGRMWKIDVAT